MLELMPAGQIDAAALAADNYFLSLLSAGAKQGILTDADLARLQSESLALLAPSEVAQLDAAVRALRRGVETEI